MKHFDFLTKPTRSILVLILSAVIVFGTVGCSSDNQSSDEPTDSPAPSSTASVETNGDFYTYDQDFSTYSPGTLLRSESFTFEDWPDVPAWKILYITEVTQDDQPVNVLSSGYVLGPSTTTDATLSATPLIALAHGTSGYVPRCAPTILGEEVMLSGVPNLSEILNRGYAIVGTDYPGMGTNGLNPYLIGQDEAKAVLDSIRAAGQISELTLTNHNTIMGHSQGGGAALWTGILAPKYAPELNIAGVIAAAPASNIPQVFKDFGTNDLDRHIQAYALASFSN
ncbi:MAG: lipase family protein, partial [Bifidobacteriaceae bacterium]|nr:lipase family protein [Bifidobacteriaceae bacterium]